MSDSASKSSESEPSAEGWRDTSSSAAPTAGAEPVNFPDRAGAQGERIMLGVPLKADGSPDWDRARPKTIERFRVLFQDPSTKLLFGEAKEPVACDKELANAALGIFFQTQAFVFAATKKVPLPVAAQLFMLTEKEHEQIDPVAQEVLGKYLPLWLLEYQKEIALCTMLARVTVAKFANASAYVSAQRQKDKEAKRATAPQSGDGEVSAASPVYVQPVEPVEVTAT